MPDSAIATAADYADALITARRAKNVLVLLLMLMILAQLAIFFTARYTDLATPTAVAATQPTTLVTDNGAVIVKPVNDWFEKLQYVVGLSDFLGVTFSLVLSFVVLLLVQIMLVGRLIGVSRVTSAYIWTLVLIVLLFPWQAFLNNVAFDRPEFKIPGVLYTWDELRLSAKLGLDHAAELPRMILLWARFVAFPVLTVLILLAVQIKSNRGLRQALGEADYPVDDTLRT